MVYKFKKYKENNQTKEARRTNKNDEAAVRNFYKNGYSQGAGGYGTQIGTAESRLNDLYNNNNLSSTFNYSRQSNLDEALSNLQNQEEFHYDINNDVLYQTAREQAMRMGKTAMEDTMGRAAAMAGGYGNSYATTAGAQAYNAHIQQLNNSIGDYYSMALNAYNTEKDRRQGIVNALTNDKNLESNIWKSGWDVYNNLYNTYANDLNNLRNLDQGAWKAQGEGLASVAGLSGQRYQNYATNGINVWNSAQQHKQAQAKQDEERKQNEWQRNFQERQFKEQQDQNRWQRQQSSKLQSKRNNSGSKTTNKTKTKLTNKQRNNNVDALITDILKAVKQSNGGSLASNGNKSNQAASNIANSYINRAISLGLLDNKGANQVREALGV